MNPKPLNAERGGCCLQRIVRRMDDTESNRLRNNIWALRRHNLKRNARRLWRYVLHVLTLGLGDGIIY